MPVGIKDGTNTVGDFVMINAMMIQLYQPLNFMGMVYREIKQAVIDIEMMFSILQRDAGDQGQAGCAGLARETRALFALRMSPSPTSRSVRS